MIVWSYGGGVQTVAIACLIKQGKLPKPDIAVIADTGREAETTWSFMNEVVQPMLAPIGLTIEVASHNLATVDLYSRKGTLLIPAFTNHTGKIGQLPGYCSVEWKRRVVRRFLKKKGVRRCKMWLGISLDEVGRAKPADVGWITHEWPLLDLKLRRRDCVQLIKDAGLPTAPKSSCWMCPYRGKEWQSLTAGDRAKAEAFEAEMRAKDPSLFLRDDGRLLAEAWDDKPRPDSTTMACDGGGYCWS